MLLNWKNGLDTNSTTLCSDNRSTIKFDRVCCQRLKAKSGQYKLKKCIDVTAPKTTKTRQTLAKWKLSLRKNRTLLYFWDKVTDVFF